MKHLKAETTYDSSESFIPSPTSPPSQPHQLYQGREEGVVIERKMMLLTAPIAKQLVGARAVLYNHHPDTHCLVP